MYTERVQFEFFNSVTQSTRLEFLVRLARVLEAVPLPPSISTSNPGFSINVQSNGKVIVDIWHPWKRDALWSEVRHGFNDKLYQVTSPTNVVEPTKDSDDSDI